MSWWDNFVNSKPVQATTALGSKAAALGGRVANSRVGKGLGVLGNYTTGDTIGEHLGTIVGADDPSNWGMAGGAAYAAAMPLTKTYGTAFDIGYGVGEMLDDATGASKFWGNWLSETDPFNQNAQSHNYKQDNDYIAARNRYLAKQQAKQDAINNVARNVIDNAVGTIGNRTVNGAPLNEVAMESAPVHYGEVPEGIMDTAEDSGPNVVYEGEAPVNYDGLVNSIIKGDLDNGNERIRRLQALGYSPADIKYIQGLVNARMYAMRGRR